MKINIRLLFALLRDNKLTLNLNKIQVNDNKLAEIC